MIKYKCDSCGSCVCYVRPKEDWSAPDPGACVYNVGYPTDWRRVITKGNKAKKERKGIK